MKQKLSVIFLLTLLFAVSCFAQTAPSVAKDYFDRAIALINEGKFAQAVAALREAQKLEPKSYEIQTNSGMALFALERFNEAVAVFESAAAIKPQEAAAHFNLCLAGRGARHRKSRSRGSQKKFGEIHSHQIVKKGEPVSQPLAV